MTKKKIAIAIAAAALAGTCAIGGTLAWLTASTEEVTNTFTMGNVNITLDETKVGGTGHDDRWSPSSADDEQSYTLSPGTTVDKDPTVTVKTGSDNCFVFVAVKDTLTTNNPSITYIDSALEGDEEDATKAWQKATLPEGASMPAGYTLYYYYNTDTQTSVVSKSNSDTVLPDLFDGLNIPSSMTGLTGDGNTIDVDAFAIQSDNLAGDNTDESARLAVAIEEAVRMFGGTVANN